MPVDHCIVSGCDAKYFPFLRGLFASLASRNCPKLALDFGMAPEQVAELREAGIRVVRHDYPFDFPARAQVETSRPGFRGMLARPYLDEVGAGHSVVMWIDADAWVQRPAALDLIVDEAARHGAAAIPEIDRSYFKFARSFRVWNLEAQVMERCFGRETATRMYLAPTFNSGVFAIQSGSPLWGVWKEYLRAGLQRIAAIDDETRMVEQIALNLAIWLTPFPVRALPCTYNWMCCLAKPLWDPERRLLVEPSPPYEPLHVVHLSTHVLGKGAEIATVGGAGSPTIRTSLDFESIAALRAA
mgnify:CR=1 FL=1